MNIEPVLRASEQGDLADAMMDFVDELLEIVDGVGLDATPSAVRTAVLVAATDAAMNNDGVTELDGTPISGRIADVKAALTTMGLDQRVSLLDQALAEPANVVHLDAWSGCPDDLEAVLAQWVVRHEAEFREFG